MSTVPLSELPALLRSIGPVAAGMRLRVLPAAVTEPGRVLRASDGAIGRPRGVFVVHDEATARGVTSAMARFLGAVRF